MSAVNDRRRGLATVAERVGGTRMPRASLVSPREALASAAGIRPHRVFGPVITSDPRGRGCRHCNFVGDRRARTIRSGGYGPCPERGCGGGGCLPAARSDRSRGLLRPHNAQAPTSKEERARDSPSPRCPFWFPRTIFSRHHLLAPRPCCSNLTGFSVDSLRKCGLG